MTCIFESFLAAVILLTVSLNALTQVLLEGSISRPLFAYASTIAPRLDEDFSLVLIRIGVASLEATSVAGLGNEVGGVVVSDALHPSCVYGTLEMNRTGVVSISPTVERRGGREKVQRGFANEIRNVKTGSRERDLWDRSWYKGLARLAVALWRCVRGLGHLSWSALRGRPCPLRHPPSDSSSLDSDHGRDPALDQGAERMDVYSRFLRGESVSDDEDDEEYEPPTPAGQRSSSSSSDHVDCESDGASATEDSEGETVALYADLSTGLSTSASVPASVLLAHMSSPSTSPLTRRRYRQLLTSPWETQTGPSAWDDWPEVIQERNSKKGRKNTVDLVRS